MSLLLSFKMLAVSAVLTSILLSPVAVAAAETTSVVGTSRVTANSLHLKRIVKGCFVVGEKPFFLTKHRNKMYGQGRITRCTRPPPDACKLTVDLESKEPTAFFWHTVMSRSTRWRSCKKLTRNTPPFICHASPSQFD